MGYLNEHLIDLYKMISFALEELIFDTKMELSDMSIMSSRHKYG